ncbi:MAG: HesA/MoeB/ThiF family protein [Oscillospiraceae bacterium]|nr:HesA/MoeB/ThiF family protein [Oscillospiraceae bacterium]
MILDDTLKEIYSRQIMMKEIGTKGQQKLADASVLVIGCGGLGAPVLSYLTAMGIGHLGFCDCDTVALSNMNRQLLFGMDDMDKSKAFMAEKRLLNLNPRLKTTVYDCFLDESLASEIVPHYDIVVDCLDNFNTRLVLNDACVAAQIPLVHAGIGEFYGQLMTITPGTGPCLRCLFPNKKKEAEPKKPFGVVGSTPGVLGAMQALEVLKYLMGLPVANSGLTIYDGLGLSLEKVNIEPALGCICRKKE